ncbi:MAG: dihydroorotase [Deltaproteobacteria bacterium]
MSLLIRQGRVVDPVNGVDEVRDLLLDKGVVAAAARQITATADTVIDAAGRIVIPGVIDMHVHLREPGREDKETVATGTRAALAGGVTTVLAMPNTEPAMDTAAAVRQLTDIGARTAACRVLVCGTLTKGRAGKEPVAVPVLKEAGVIALSDDGTSVEDPAVMEEVLKAARAADLPVICHCEDKALSGRGVMNLGYMSTVLGLRGIPREAESERVKRDILLAAKTGAAIHIAHVSCRESVELVREAKKKKISVTAETAPHYFALTEEALIDFDTNFKMNPPLRTAEDVAAVRAGLKDGTIDCIASDHAPHTENEKEIEFDRAEFGVVGLETELAVALTELIGRDILTWPQLVMKFCVNPARILKCGRGHLAAGAPADVVIVDPAVSWRATREGLVSKSRNSAFLGRTLTGRVLHTIREGSLAFTRAETVEAKEPCRS